MSAPSPKQIGNSPLPTPVKTRFGAKELETDPSLIITVTESVIRSLVKLFCFLQIASPDLRKGAFWFLLMRSAVLLFIPGERKSKLLMWLS